MFHKKKKEIKQQQQYMTTYKTIMKGRLEFGSSQTYEKVLRLYQPRVENYHKNDVLFKIEEVFDETDIAFNIERTVVQSSKKTWQNSVLLLEYVAQYAIAGSISIWMVDEGKVIGYAHIEPRNDHSSVRDFLRGRELSRNVSLTNEAMLALDSAIEKYDRHAQAYERRAFVNFQLQKYHDALRDYNKSIQIYGGDAEPYYGRGIIHSLQGNLDEAIIDFDLAMKRAIPHQSIYWKARRRKADAFLKKGDFKNAEQELRLFNSRKFGKDDPNLRHKRWALYAHGVALAELNRPKEALPLFDQALISKDVLNNLADAAILEKKEQLGKAGSTKTAASKSAEKNKEQNTTSTSRRVLEY
jgi:tetratricopeptide (TPR) repeat protein